MIDDPRRRSSGYRAQAALTAVRSARWRPGDPQRARDDVRSGAAGPRHDRSRRDRDRRGDDRVGRRRRGGGRAADRGGRRAAAGSSRRGSSTATRTRSSPATARTSSRCAPRARATSRSRPPAAASTRRSVRRAPRPMRSCRGSARRGSSGARGGHDDDRDQVGLRPDHRGRAAPAALRSRPAAPRRSAIVPTLLAHLVPPERAADRDVFVREICEQWIPRAAARAARGQRRRLVRRGRVHARRDARDPRARRRRPGCRCAATSASSRDIGAAELFAERGALSASITSSRSATPAIAMLAKAGTVAVMLPGACVQLRLPVPPIEQAARRRRADGGRERSQSGHELLRDARRCRCGSRPRTSG